MTRYILAAIAGIWMADGLALLAVPLLVIKRVQESLLHSPQLLRWEAVGIGLGAILIVWSGSIPYQPLWWITGSAMIIKGVSSHGVPPHGARRCWIGAFPAKPSTTGSSDCGCACLPFCCSMR
jgi:hypothetical protein